MGCLSSSDSSPAATLQADSRAIAVNEKMQPWLQHPQSISPDNHIYKMLLFGFRNSEKLTTFKCIPATFNDDDDEKVDEDEVKSIIRQNCVCAILSLLRFAQIKMEDDMSSDIERIVSVQYADFINNPIDIDELIKLGKSMENIWNLESIQFVYKCRMKGQHFLHDNMDYFLNKITRIMNKECMITNEDCLRCKKRRTGCIIHKYKINDNEFHLCHLGGQRNERRKWIHNLENVSLIFFVIGLSDFCKGLSEDVTRNNLQESLEQFSEIINSKWFQRTDIVVLLNKMDLFRICLKQTPLTFCFKDEYKGRNFHDHQIDVELANKMIPKLLPKIVGDIGNDLIIPLDVINIIVLYFDIREEWLDLCVNDGVEFIKQKCLSLHDNMRFKTNRQIIGIYHVSAISVMEIQHVMNEIHDMIPNRASVLKERVLID